MPAQRWFVLGSALFYLASLALPAITGSAFPDLTGMDVLRQGAGAWRDGVVAWYANPLLLAALITIWFRSYRAGLAFSLIALALGVSSFGAGWVAAWSGRSVPPFGFASGFYVWLVAFLLAIAGSLVGYIRSRSSEVGLG